MQTRRNFLKILAQAGASLSSAPFSLAGERVDEPADEPVDGRADKLASQDRVLVNDIHSQLNPTYVREVVHTDSLARLQDTLTTAKRTGQSISIAGGRHSMGGQQFGTGTLLLDTRPMSQVLNFDTTRGLVEVEAGIQWPELISYLIEAQKGQTQQWGIVQKQTGADRLCLGGALGANVHGRGLTFKPLIGDVESFRLVDANGALRQCSRSENSELFRLVIGGYGLFGVIVSITLRLAPRKKLERVVEIIDTGDLMPALERRIADGYLYGDCQFSIDPGSEDFLKKGVFSCYRPVDNAVPIPATQKTLSANDWRQLYALAHNDPKRIFEVYSSYYLSTTGQIYWSDTHQLGTYVDDYHKTVDQQSGADWPGSEMITEVYVPRPALGLFLDALAVDFRRYAVKVIYGTIRLIEKDDESFLPWARDSYACIVINLHVSHNPPRYCQGGKRFPAYYRQGHRTGRQLFLNLSPLGQSPTTRRLLSADVKIFGTQTSVRP